MSPSPVIGETYYYESRSGRRRLRIHHVGYMKYSVKKMHYMYGVTYHCGFEELKRQLGIPRKWIRIPVVTPNKANTIRRRSMSVTPN